MGIQQPGFQSRFCLESRILSGCDFSCLLRITGTALPSRAVWGFNEVRKKRERALRAEWMLTIMATGHLGASQPPWNKWAARPAPGQSPALQWEVSRV